jgi:hypothetical protein
LLAVTVAACWAQDFLIVSPYRRLETGGDGWTDLTGAANEVSVPRGGDQRTGD